jgi:hypothetical protein
MAAEHGREQQINMIARIAIAGVREEEEDRAITFFSIL